MTDKTTPEPVDPFTPEELKAIVDEVLADTEDTVMMLTSESAFPEHPDLPPVRVRMIIEWPVQAPPDWAGTADYLNYQRRTAIARMATVMAGVVNDELAVRLPVELAAEYAEDEEQP